MSKNYSVAAFSDLHKCMEANKPLPWNLGLDSIKASANLVDSGEGQRFIEEHLLRILYIMTQQSPSKIGVNEKAIIEESIMLSVKICVKLLTKQPHLLRVLGRLFDPKVPFYFGSKVGFTFTPGHPAVRLQAVRKFHDSKGFIVLANLLKTPDCIWPGGDVFLTLLNIIKSQDIGGLIDDKTKESIVLSSMKLFLQLPDEQLKKESTDALSSFINALGHIYFPLPKSQFPNKHDPFYSFWFHSIVKCMHSSSIVFKLFSWDQLKELISEAKFTRPFASSFVVEGAGTEMVNGVYRCIQRTADVDALQYSKVPTQPNMPLLTLFRCTMRNAKSKWWFLSQADLERPGTDKDVDYYLHCSSGDEEREPSSTGWTNAQSGMTLLGFSPPPLLRRGEPLLLPKGVTKDMYLDHKLIEWIGAENFISAVYNPSSMHREIISRSRLMLSFLLDYDAFHVDYLRAIWIALVKNAHDQEIVDEIVLTLVQMMHQMTASLFEELMKLMQEGYEKISEEPGYEIIIARILELLASEDCKHVTFVCQRQKFSHLITFLWKIYRESDAQAVSSSSSTSYANKLLGIIQELLSFCFEQRAGSQIALERIHELRQVLTRQVLQPASGVPQELEERQIDKHIQTLLFLLSTKRVYSEEYLQALKSIGLEKVLAQEINRFALLHRPLVNTNQCDSVWYSRQLQIRFEVLKRYFSITYVDKIADTSPKPQALLMLQSLWQLVRTNPTEIDIFMMLLISPDPIPQIAPELLAMLSKKDLLCNIYEAILCDPVIEWRTAKQHTFDCFKAYYTQLEGLCTTDNLSNEFDEMELPPSLGLETVWNIALSIQDPSVVNQAIELLLLGYEQLNLKKLGSSNEIVDKLFQQLQLYTNDLSHHQEDMTRSLTILTQAIRKFGNGKEISHFAGSLICRIPLTVYYRRYSYHFDPQTKSNVLKHDKHGDGMVQVEIHPYHSIYTLKQKIIKTARLPANAIITFEHSDVVLHNNSRVHELHLAPEHAELSISYSTDTNPSYKNSYAHTLGDDVHNLSHTSAATGTSSLYGDDLYSDGYYDRSFTSTGDVANTSFQSTGTGGGGDREEEDERYSFTHRDSCAILGTYLIDDYSKFDFLLTLAEQLISSSSQSGNQELFGMVWEILMTLPTQKNIQDLFFAQNYMYRETSWNQIFDLTTLSSSLCRTAYTLQMTDMLLQPAEEVPFLSGNSATFFSKFLQSEGLTMVIDIVLALDSLQHETDNGILFNILAVALHILHFLLISNLTVDSAQKALFAYLQRSEEKARALLQQLLFVTRRAAAREDSAVVHNALALITVLVRSPVVAATFIGNNDSKALLIHVLGSQAKKVRETACEVAINIGRVQPIVFTWLAQAFQTIDSTNSHCWELIVAVRILLQEYYDTVQQSAAYAQTQDLLASEVVQLCDFVTNQLWLYPEYVLSGKIASFVGEEQERYVLLGYLELLNIFLQHLSARILSTPFGTQLVHTFFTKFLFTTSVHNSTASSSDLSDALCDTPKTRQLAYQVLSSVVKVSPEAYNQIVDELSGLVTQASKHMHHCWGLQVTDDMKKPEIQYTGLKNQGCTCYLNSCLQTLFMLPRFRKAVLATPIRACHRTTLWYKNDLDLIGEDVMFEWANGTWRLGKVIGYDEDLAMHRIQYFQADSSSLDEVVLLNIHEGRPQRETGRVRLCPKDGESVDTLTPQEQDAYRVLEELQRTFSFLHLSKKRYFDPRPFVDACKSLNLNFNVYHQNDAVEFYDQLLDRLETASKGKHTKQDLWKELFMKEVFGGQWLHQKIPTDCAHFQKNKAACGHSQSAQLETYLKVEIMIRGKEKIEDSLEGSIQGELFDGENKLSCDVCQEKKAAIRRTCFGSIPETLILHLKRFDLDYQTFETVKLNSKMSFTNRINILKYTKEGIEIAEAEGKEGTTPLPRDQHGRIELAYHEGATQKVTVIDPEDYEYELNGILVHAGIAQGGHYYSYIRANPPADAASSTSTSDSPTATGEMKWYRFDDDEVTPFDPEQIAAECFGGSSGMLGSHEDDRTANALMLFYTKVKKSSSSSTQSTASPSASSSMETTNADTPTDLIDGLQAYQREVNESNLQHMLTCFLIDPELHAFVRGLISSLYSTTSAALATSSSTSLPSPNTTSNLHATNVMSLQWSPTDEDDDLPLRTVQFSCRFLLDVVLHCRERPAVRTFLHIMKGAFETYPHTAIWFLNQIVSSNSASSSTPVWANEYLLYATDVLARVSFVQLFVYAVSAIAPKQLMAVKNVPATEVRKEIPWFSDPAALCARIVRYTLDLTLKVTNFTRTADEIFLLIRDLATIPSLGVVYRGINMITFLSYFIIPEYLPPAIRGLYEKQQVSTKQPLRTDYSSLQPSVFEAIGAILGISPCKKVNLLQEKSYWETELVPEAKEAFTVIFQESCKSSAAVASGLDLLGIVHYLERVTGVTNQKATSNTARNVLDRFGGHHHGEHKLSLEGFLAYQADVASFNPKNVWRDLHAFGFRNDLTRTTSSGVSTRSVVMELNDDSSSDELDSTTQTATAKRARTNGFTSSRPKAPVVTLADLSENCRNCLLNIMFYEAGLNTTSSVADETVKSIVEKICLHNPDAAEHLLTQGLTRLYSFITENSWNANTTNLMIDFVKTIVTIPDRKLNPDGLGKRLHILLFAPSVGLAKVLAHERERPTVCRANEYNRANVADRYAGLLQDMASIPECLRCIKSLAKHQPEMQTIKGMLRCKPGMTLTENEYREVKHTVVIVEHAGNVEVNGEYVFTSIKNNAGYYSRIGQFNGHPARFTLYKCTLRNGGHQWFLSITPPGQEPGTTNDTDFYFAPAKPSDLLPPLTWQRLNHTHVKDPPPKIRKVRSPIQEDSESESEGEEEEEEDNVNMGEEEGTGEIVDEGGDSDLDSVRVNVNHIRTNEDLDSLDSEDEERASRRRMIRSPPLEDEIVDI